MSSGVETKAEATFHFSDRVNRIAVSATAAVVDAAAKLKARGVDVVDFGMGQPDFNTPDHIKQAAVRALEANHTQYTTVAGIAPLRLARRSVGILLPAERVRGERGRETCPLQRGVFAD